MATTVSGYNGVLTPLLDSVLRTSSSILETTSDIYMYLWRAGSKPQFHHELRRHDHEKIYILRGGICLYVYYVYMYIYIIYACTHIYIYIYIQICIFIYINICYTYIYTYIYICI